MIRQTNYSFMFCSLGVADKVFNSLNANFQFRLSSNFVVCQTGREFDSFTFVTVVILKFDFKIAM